MNHAELVKLAERWLNGTRKCALVATERSCFKSDESPDAIGWRSNGESVLVECKTSMADFWADQRKPHRASGAGMGLERWYLADDGVLRPDAIPDGWGLLVVRNGRVFRAIHARPRVEVAGDVARLEQPFLVALARRALWGNGNGITLGCGDAEVSEPAPVEGVA